jgi:hypothetical protein
MSGIKWFYKSRYVHKISPKDTDVGPTVGLTLKDLDDRKTLGKALREAGVSIDRVSSFRREGTGKVVVFPEKRSIWHAVVLEHEPVSGPTPSLPPGTSRG